MRQPVGRLLPALRLLQLLPDSQDAEGYTRDGIQAHGSRVGSGGTVSGIELTYAQRE